LIECSNAPERSVEYAYENRSRVYRKPERIET